MKNYYAILGVEPTATQREIKKAYVPLALRHHPDLAPEAERDSARARYREIQTAYWILSDSRLRDRFDRKSGLRQQKGRVEELLDMTLAASRVAPSERLELEQLFSKAEVAFARGQAWEAAGILEKLVEKIPGEGNWQRLYAQAAARCGAYDRALRACEASLLVSPDAPESHWVRAEVLAESGDYAGAARACRHALELAPDHEPSKKLLEKVTALRVALFRQKVTLPLYVAAAVGLVALVAFLVWLHGRG